MKLLMITDEETGVEIFPQLEEALKEQVIDLEIETAKARALDEIPAKIKSQAEDTDLFFVFVLYVEENFKVKTLLEKLIDLELQINKKIIKAIEETEVEDPAEEEKKEESKRLADKYSKAILDEVVEK